MERIFEYFQVDWVWGSFAWNGIIKIVFDVITKSPAEYSPAAWEIIKNELYPYFQSVAAALVNMFFLIGFLRQNINLRENITTEVFIENGIKIVVANGLLINGITMMEDFLTCSTTITSAVLGTTAPQLSVGEYDLGSTAFIVLFGWSLYLIFCIVCGVMVLTEVFKRFLFINLSIILAPVGIVTLVGGRGLENTAFAWIKTFIMYCFQIVMIALILRIGTAMGSNLAGFMQSNGGIGELFDGFTLFLNNIVFILFMTSAIRSSDSVMEKMFALR